MLTVPRCLLVQDAVDHFSTMGEGADPGVTVAMEFRHSQPLAGGGDHATPALVVHVDASSIVQRGQSIAMAYAVLFGAYLGTGVINRLDAAVVGNGGANDAHDFLLPFGCEVALFYQVREQITRPTGDSISATIGTDKKRCCLEILQAVILGLVQGFTEFIPISSSGHLILVGNFLHFAYSGLAFDTALNIGTLAALLTFFWKDFWKLARDFVLGGSDRKLAWYIIVATIPAVVFGILVQDLAETVFRSNVLVAFNLIWVAVLMIAVDTLPQLVKKVQDVKLPQAVVVGFAQALALIPGTSRSGITIIAGRAMKMDRVTATRFSFLLSAPIITGATLKLILQDSTLNQMSVMPAMYIGGILGAFVAGYFSIKFLINYLSKNGLAIFAYYRIVVGVLILLTTGLA